MILTSNNQIIEQLTNSPIENNPKPTKIWESRHTARVA